MEGLPCQGVWAFPEDSKNPLTVSKEKTALVRPVSHQYRKVFVLQWGMGWMVQNQTQSPIRRLCQ